ncbi:hypothetical protein B0H14DRAFT_2574917 [Mycena olivaceomarginata]|nr:hypothetical protein B0H14DRAFT_2574917 [Mycena olivaceomarginata]
MLMCIKDGDLKANSTSFEERKRVSARHGVGNRGPRAAGVLRKCFGNEGRTGTQVEWIICERGAFSNASTNSHGQLADQTTSRIRKGQIKLLHVPSDSMCFKGLGLGAKPSSSNSFSSQLALFKHQESHALRNYTTSPGVHGAISSSRYCPDILNIWTISGLYVWILPGYCPDIKNIRAIPGQYMDPGYSPDIVQILRISGQYLGNIRAISGGPDIYNIRAISGQYPDSIYNLRQNSCDDLEIDGLGCLLAQNQLDKHTQAQDAQINEWNEKCYSAQPFLSKVRFVINLHIFFFVEKRGAEVRGIFSE